MNTKAIAARVSMLATVCCFSVFLAEAQVESQEVQSQMVASARYWGIDSVPEMSDYSDIQRAISQWADASANATVPASTKAALIADFLVLAEVFADELATNLGAVRGDISSAFESYLDAVTAGDSPEAFLDALENELGVSFGGPRPGPSRYGFLLVLSQPPVADLYIDDFHVGSTGTRYLVLVGRRSVSVRKDSFPDCKKEANVSSHNLARVECTLSQP